jgi:hypothetical protein
LHGRILAWIFLAIFFVWNGLVADLLAKNVGPGDGRTVSPLSWDGRLGIGLSKDKRGIKCRRYFHLFVCLFVYYYYILEVIC